jgi:hypothetical protein
VVKDLKKEYMQKNNGPKIESEALNFKSDFFKTLKQKEWFWVMNALQSRDDRPKNQLKQFDKIAYDIETSSCHKKRCLSVKLKKIIDHMVTSRVEHKIQSESRAKSPNESEKIDPKTLERCYAEDTNYRAIFSEMKVFDELSKLGLQQIQFLEEASESMPDLKAMDNEQSIFVEVKVINPPKEEEQRMMAPLNNPELLPTYHNWWDLVKGKLDEDLNNAKTKFESVNAYTENHRRWVYVYFVKGVDARLHPKNLFNNDLIRELEEKFKIEIKFFETF